jgi:hypothetical protein
MLSPQRRRGVAAEWAASAADPVVNAILLADQVSLCVALCAARALHIELVSRVLS